MMPRANWLPRCSSPLATSQMSRCCGVSRGRTARIARARRSAGNWHGDSPIASWSRTKGASRSGLANARCPGRLSDGRCSLCCAFSSQEPDRSATRDQVLDALWPDLDPDTAANSLNQTLYFLRRVFEEEYAEDLSPGYIRHEGDVIWLDQDLISSRSGQCLHLLRSLPPDPTPDDVDRLSGLYRGRFALDFEYEEWASAYRDNVHAAYLEVVERSLLKDVSSGHHSRAITIARRALEVDPRSDQIEVSLLRLYKATSAHSAAAELYVHYSTVLRDELGVEPPPLDSL